MNPSAFPLENLEQAFSQFQNAAERLSRQQIDLRSRAEHLEDELARSNDQLVAVLEAIDAAVVVVAPSGAIVRSNEKWKEWIGDTSRWPERLRRPGADAVVRESLADRELAITADRIPGVEALEVITVRDVTELRREADEDGRRTRLEALGRMAAELAHEVRNPLGGIQLYAGLIADELPEDSRPREWAERILGGVAGLESTVSNLLGFARPYRPTRGELDLAELAREVVALFETTSELRGVELVGPAADERVVVDGDAEGLRRVVLNLTANALQASESGGRVAIAVEKSTHEVRLVVADRGRGIDKSDLPHVFDPFFSRSEGGTGLGLSIAARIVEWHGGRMELESDPGRGTIATASWPLDGR